MTDWQATHALIVIDVQRGFDDPHHWGRRNNFECESNVAALVAAWRERQWPVVFVRHDSRDPSSPLSPTGPGNAFKAVLQGEPELLVAKQTNSSFYGTPDLHAWLQQRAISSLAICGISTNHCCETSARMAGNLDYDTKFVIDATHSFDLKDLNGELIPADELARITAANLNAEFATIVTTEQVLTDLPSELGSSARGVRGGE